MSAKTAAEIQIEFLKKLKAEKKNPPKDQAQRAKIKEAAAAATANPANWRLTKSRSANPRNVRSLSMSATSWRKLQDYIKRMGGGNKLRQGLGDWAVDLILAAPNPSSMNQELKSELFKRMRDWTEVRGLK